MAEQQPNFVSSRHYIEVAERFTGIGFWNADMTSGEVRATHGFFKIVGLKGAGALDLPQWISLIHPQDKDDFRSLFAIADMAVPVSRVVRLTSSERAMRWIRVAIDEVRQGTGPSGLVIGMVQDVTGERESRAALYRERARLDALLQMTGKIFWATDLNGIVVDMRGWEALTGQSPAEAANGGWVDAVHVRDRERVLEEWAASFRSATPYAVSYLLRYRDGEYRRVTVRGTPVRSEGGAPVEWLGTIQETWRQEAAELRCAGDAALQPQQLRAARALLGWSADRLAWEAGISTATIRRYEAGEAHLKEATISAILSALARHDVVMTHSPTTIGLCLASSRTLS